MSEGFRGPQRRQRGVQGYFMGYQEVSGKIKRVSEAYQGVLGASEGYMALQGVSWVFKMNLATLKGVSGAFQGVTGAFRGGPSCV